MRDLSQHLEIIEFSDELEQFIRILNYEWLEKYFRIEPSDKQSLSNPRKEIIDKGGFIFYAKLDDKIIGTVSLIKKTATVFELSKMAVSETTQGKGIGKAMIVHCLQFAKDKGIERIILYSNTALESALHLYRKYGFYEIEMESGIYERANIKMEKRIV